MSTRIEVVDPLPYAETASTILQASWKPPCLYYSPEYLAWQFSFPSPLPNRAVIAFLDDRAVGCVAVTSRRFVFDGAPISAYVLSFVAVDPAARGHGIAALMYSRLLDTITADTPVIAFAEPGSVGERLLLDAFGKASFQHRPLDACRAMGYVTRSVGYESAAAIITKDYDEFVSLSLVRDQSTIWNNPTAEQWEHYRTDPRSRVMMILRDPEHQPVGTAMVVAAEVLSPQGLQQVAMLENVVLPNGPAEALVAAFHLSARHCRVSSMVIAPNLSCLDTGLLKKAGTRAIGSVFNAHLFARGGNGLLANAIRTSVEVI
jgi:GNAT superfamily N-acetyltransferase